MCEMSLVKKVMEWLEEEELTFAISVHDEEETVFLVYINSVNQSALLVGVTVNETEGGELLRNFAPYIPKSNIAIVRNEMKQLTFLNAPIAELYLDDEMDDCVIAISSININDMRSAFIRR